jgi:copper oxidase (laccase) domain-containing protein
MFDLPAFVLARLETAGVEACEWVGRDTRAEGHVLFEPPRLPDGEADYGRLLSAIVLEAGGMRRGIDSGLALLQAGR